MHSSHWLLALLLVVSACVDSDSVENQLAESSSEADPRDEIVTNATPEPPLAYPVRIGEDGPRFDACGGVGRVRGLGTGDRLDVQVAPFDYARATDGLENEDMVFICTRSLDQKWFGIVYPGEGQDHAECGVSSPVKNKRKYEGPCKSGWVSSAFIQLIAG